MVELFIVAGVRLYREGLVQALERAGNLHVTATAADLAELCDRIGTPDRAVLLFDGTCLKSAASLRAVLAAHPNVRAVVLGVTESEPEIIGWAEAGASGYVTRDGSVDELVKTVEAVARDELTCPPRITAALMHRVAALATEQPLITPLPARLSHRELEVVQLIDDGLSNQEIAHRLFITLATVKNHVHNILDKLGVRTRTEAAALVRRRPQESSGRQPWPGHIRATGTGSNGRRHRVPGMRLGARGYGTVKSFSLFTGSWPTYRIMGPVVAPSGTETVRVFSESALNFRVSAPVNATLVTEVRLVPLITTGVPGGPSSGLNSAMVGIAISVTDSVPGSTLVNRVSNTDFSFSAACAENSPTKAAMALMPYGSGWLEADAPGRSPARSTRYTIVARIAPTSGNRR